MDSMDIHEILEHLPHRYPFLLVDRILECEPDNNIVALKNVTVNEPFFQFNINGLLVGVGGNTMKNTMFRNCCRLSSKIPTPEENHCFIKPGTTGLTVVNS